MIVTAGTPPSPDSKSAPAPAPPAGQPSPPLPPSTPQHHTPVAQRQPRRSASARFFHTLGAAALIGLVVLALARLRRAPRPEPGTWGAPIPDDVRVARCAPWVRERPPGGRFPHAAGAHFTLPADRAVAVFAQGGLAGGALSVVPGAPGDAVRVHVSVRYHSEALRGRAAACLARRPGDAVDGVGIFTPARWDSRGASGRLYFVVTVAFPAGAGGPLPISAFRTDLVDYAQTLGALGGAVDFGRVALHSTNGPVRAEALSAADLSVKTTNAPITGAYNASGRLTLATTNGAIAVDVAMAHDPRSVPARLVLETTNGAIDAAATLASAGGAGGAFEVRATTTNRRLDVAFAEGGLPRGARLSLRAHTTNAPARVEVPAQYEGPVSLATTNAVLFVEHRALADPEGRGRVRGVHVVEETKNVLRARLSWGDGGGERGDGLVDVATTNGRATLAV